MDDIYIVLIVISILAILVVIWIVTDLWCKRRWEAPNTADILVAHADLLKGREQI
jgi:hypothetical protein